MVFSDARLYQICFLSIFLLAGIGSRDWTFRPDMILVAIATCVLTQWICSAFTNQNREISETECATLQQETGVIATAISRFQINSLLNTLPSALITSLGLSLLLRTGHYSTMMLAGVVAIASKFVLRLRGKHVFNPANVGIIAALTFSQDAWVSPGQWGEESWYALLFLSTGGLVLQRVGRWDTTAAFLGGYAGLEAVRNLWLGWTWDVWLHRLMSGSLLLFALFMITDPRTIPNARIGRIIWAIAIALLTFVLRNYCFLSTAVFWSLFVLAPLSPLLDLLFPSSRFEWNERPLSLQDPSSTPA
ncbi:MAG TPA: RnfABCDGE type electron transport complex subunit D [Crinalium sp.]